ncbi:sulfatase [Streptosporangium amethystogenes subsp. fukuiense]
MSMSDLPGKHIVLFICDQMQYMRQGRVDPLARTPNLDALADEGVFFDRFYCSNPQCSPSRMSLQTGLHPHEAGVMVIYGFGGHTGHLGPRHRTIAQVLKEHGYRTAYFGKSHFGYPLEKLGYEKGIERGGGGSLAVVDEEITRDATNFLASYDATEPLFLVISLHQPHPPFESVEPYIRSFDPEQMPIPPSFADDLTGRPEFQRKRRESPGGGVTRQQLRLEMTQYYSMITKVDELFGRVRHALEGRGLWNDSVIAFTSDHGDMMGGHGLRLKGTFPYEELFRVPLIIKAPGVAGGARTASLGVNVSLPRTLMELAGVEVPDDWPNRSVTDVVLRQAEGPEQVFMEHYGAYWGWHPFRMIVTRSYKYVYYYGPDEPAEELYDLQHDPHEERNLAADTTYEDLKHRLKAKLESWWRTTEGRTFTYYESDEFKRIDAATLVDDNELWAFT